jgi:hypothetical protein
MKKYPLSLLLVFLSFYVQSQNYSFQVGGNFTSGNLLSYGLLIKSSLSSKPDKKYQLSFSPTFDYSMITNQKGQFELRKREILSIINYERPRGIFKFYVYNEVENSYLRKISLRGSFGCGASIKIYSDVSSNFDISQFVLPELFQSSFNNKRDNYAFRLSTRIRYNLVKERYKYSTQILLQPAVYTRLFNGTEIGFKKNTNIRLNQSYEYVLSKNFSIGLSNDITIQTYTSYINPLIKPYDTNMNLFVKGNF